MGESRRKKMRAIVEEASRQWIDGGKLIEAGWVSLRMMAIPENASKIQLDEMRNAFFAGAQHLFGTIMTVLDPGSEPTDADMRRLDLVHKELDEFIKEFERKIETKGTA
jgi:hypothetical protein